MAMLSFGCEVTVISEQQQSSLLAEKKHKSAGHLLISLKVNRLQHALEIFSSTDSFRNPFQQCLSF